MPGSCPETDNIESRKQRLKRMDETIRKVNELRDEDISNDESECNLAEQKKIRYRINEDNLLTREAIKAGKNSQVQKDLNHLEKELMKGNENPGIGRKSIGSGIIEHRARNGGRLYVREVDGVIEILGKSGKKKTNQQAVINRLTELYN